MEDRGMRLSTRGLAVLGEQIVSVKSSYYFNAELFILKEGILLSYKHDVTAETGFISSNSVTPIMAKLDSLVLESDEIVEIAGGDSLKVRYSSGTCIKVERRGVTHYITEVFRDIARVTKHKMYGLGSPIKYYKSGGGVKPLVPLLEHEGVSNVVAIFEGESGDRIVTLEDLSAEAIIGYVGLFKVVAIGEAHFLDTPLGRTRISGFGTIKRNTPRTQHIRLFTTIQSGDSKVVDHSNVFSPSHYQYIQIKRTDGKLEWAGHGDTGYVLNGGDTVLMDVPIGANSGTIGAENTVVTPAIDDTIPFIIEGGVMKKVKSDGTLEIIDTQDLDGLALISYIYTHDMTHHIVVGAGTKEVEPFSINGYFFGYGDGHLVDANLENL